MSRPFASLGPLKLNLTFEAVGTQVYRDTAFLFDSWRTGHPFPFKKSNVSIHNIRGFCSGRNRIYSRTGDNYSGSLNAFQRLLYIIRLRRALLKRTSAAAARP